MNKFENMGSLDFLRVIEKNSIGLALIDPPYIISKASGFSNMGKKGVQKLSVYSTEYGEWDDGENFTMNDMQENINEYYRVLKKGGTFITFCDMWKISYIKEMMQSAGFKQIRLIEWVKTNPVPINSKRNYLSNCREVALLGVKVGKPTFHSQYDKGIYHHAICQDKGRFHPTQKPVKLMRELIRKHSNEGDIVLDTFAGSATTLVAAKETGREYMGCELDSACYDKALIRLNNSKYLDV
ncbi:MAG: DNA modification methylase [Acidimicrobiaceae bacterium]|nr:DNA modification methylase [Acidimicrobiaceae bacterium]